ncbi:AmmeMemoRadiSam system protein B [Candidatus Woesearchaeota archaeon]|nr:AmmeMemoRadiSam system protein B [Candidatus Woesearchaeota archaeon]
MRQPIANKTHYANGVTLLDKQFDDIFHHKLGPGALPAGKLTKPKEGNVQAIIVPHASYELAGPCAAWSYAALAEEGVASDLYIIIGQAQHSTKTGTTMQTFQMPYGEVRADQNFLRELVAKGNIALNDELHNVESVIEVQLPFLQFINKGHAEKIKIAPLIVGPETNVEELSVDIKETLLEQKKTATYIFITHFTSYGRKFHYVPFTEHIPENIAAVDKKLFNALTAFDKEGFLTAVDETMAPISGFHALRLFFQVLQPEKILLEQNYLSGDLNDDYHTTVSFASVVVKKKE